MNTKKVVFLFFSTMFLGAMGGAIIGALLYDPLFAEGGFWNFIFGVLWLLGIGAAVSATAQMGYFAYLLLNRLALSLFKTKKLWNRVQIFLIAFVFFDLFYFRYLAYATGDETMGGYLITPTLLLIYAALVAYFKQRETHRGAFIPAFFFMYVITTIEWLPALLVTEINDSVWLWIYLTPLLVANTYQLMAHHRIQENA
ncbi:KinB-signaling pathway activation protein [Natribacillus halophilus]|uniref:KinB signaling pathway activation protein n=1 Tax=Natribacillus halophilus TaxID=549003 RepID=A0A1G8QUS6_9BACI|nr:KinB-signaling pathway activation protein [Natribacillus halophilus]SDJ08065.1 KinB signaling pathway activation protein [Natribacillus halophilus]